MKLNQEYNPVVSIILASYNRADLIKNSVDSVISQTCRSWELIIVDDGSSDITRKIINEYQTNHHNILYFRHSHRGLPLTRNAGIQLSQGQYLTFIDSDDVYLPDHLQLRISFMKENPEIDLIHGGCMIIGNPYVIDKNDPEKEIHLNQCYIGGTFFGKRNVFLELNGFRNIDYSEDSDFMERALERFSIKKIDYPTYIYHRDTKDSICNTI